MAIREFRSGMREIPDHLDAIMPTDTSNMTYEQAVDAANKGLERGHIDRVADRIISDHLRVHGDVRR